MLSSVSRCRLLHMDRSSSRVSLLSVAKTSASSPLLSTASMLGKFSPCFMIWIELGSRHCPPSSSTIKLCSLARREIIGPLAVTMRGHQGQSVGEVFPDQGTRHSGCHGDVTGPEEEVQKRFLCHGSDQKCGYFG